MANGGFRMSDVGFGIYYFDMMWIIDPIKKPCKMGYLEFGIWKPEPTQIRHQTSDIRNFKSIPSDTNKLATIPIPLNLQPVDDYNQILPLVVDSSKCFQFCRLF